MAQTNSFHCPGASFPSLVADTQEWLTEQGFRCQELTTEDGGTLLQIEKAGGWRKAVGMSTALNIVFRQVADTVHVEIGAGRWIDKAAAGAVSVFVLWPLAVTAGIGAWQQIRMPERIFEFVDKALRIRGCLDPTEEAIDHQYKLPEEQRDRTGWIRSWPDLMKEAIDHQLKLPREQGDRTTRIRSGPDPMEEAIDHQLKLPREQRDRASLEQILVWCDTQLKDPEVDDITAAGITYRRARVLWLLGNAEQAREDLMGLKLIEQERKKTETDVGARAELLKRIQRERPKSRVERSILAGIYGLMAELSMEEKRSDAAMVFLQRASQVGDSETERKSKGTMRQLEAQHALALQENPPERRQILFCTADIPSWTPREFCFASADTLRSTAWMFEVGHPQPELFYVRHPLRPDRYYELEKFHDRVFDDKRNELVRLLKSMGATHVRVEAFRRSVQEHSVTTEHTQDVGASEYGLGVSGTHSDERGVRERRQIIQSETRDFDLQPVKAPHIPDDLVWYPHELDWQDIARDALEGSLKKVAVRLEYREDFTINAKRVKQIAAGLGLFSHQAGVHWSQETEERLQQRKDTIWEFMASFP